MNEESAKNFQDSLFKALNLLIIMTGMRLMMLLKKYGMSLMEMKDKLSKEFYKYLFLNFT